MPELSRKVRICACVCVCVFSRSVMSDSLRPRGLHVAHEVPLSMEFSRQEPWSGLPFPFSKGSSWPKGWTRVSFIAGRFFTVWATREWDLYPPAAEYYPHWIKFVRTAGDKRSFILVASGIVLPTIPKDLCQNHAGCLTPYPVRTLLQKTLSGLVTRGPS